jgi:hypothetical protein
MPAGRPPGSKNKPKVAPPGVTDAEFKDLPKDLPKDAPKDARPEFVKAVEGTTVEAAPRKKKVKAKLDLGKFLDATIEVPGADPLKADPQRRTLKQVAALLPLDGVSKLLELGTGQPLTPYFPKQNIIMVQTVFAMVVDSIDFEVSPMWGLLIMYGVTLVTGLSMWGVDRYRRKQNAAADKSGQPNGGKSDTAPSSGPDAKHPGNGKEGPGENDVPPRLLGEYGAPEIGN